MSEDYLLEYVIVALISEDGCEACIRPSEDEDTARDDVVEQYRQNVGDIPPAHRFVSVTLRMPALVDQTTVIVATLPEQTPQPIIATVL